jgi:hypothetical protein
MRVLEKRFTWRTHTSAKAAVEVQESPVPKSWRGAMDHQPDHPLSVIELRRRRAQASLTEGEIDPTPFAWFVPWSRDVLHTQLPHPMP